MMDYDRVMGWFFEKGEIWYRAEKHGLLLDRPDVVHWKGHAAFGILLAIWLAAAWVLPLLQPSAFVAEAVFFSTMIAFLVIYHRHLEVIDLDAPPKPQSLDKIFPGDR